MSGELINDIYMMNEPKTATECRQHYIDAATEGIKRERDYYREALLKQANTRINPPVMIMNLEDLDKEAQVAMLGFRRLIGRFYIRAK